MSGHNFMVNPNDHELIAFLDEQDAKDQPKNTKTSSLELQFIQRLVAVRRERGMSQAALAERSGLPQSVIARLEAGKGNPTLKTLTKVADALGQQLTVLRKQD